MRSTGLSINPQTIDRKTWYYEEPRGLLVVREARDTSDGYIQTEQFRIPWGKIRESLARKNNSLIVSNGSKRLRTYVQKIYCYVCKKYLFDKRSASRKQLVGCCRSGCGKAK